MRFVISTIASILAFAFILFVTFSLNVKLMEYMDLRQQIDLALLSYIKIFVFVAFIPATIVANITTQTLIKKGAIARRWLAHLASSATSFSIVVAALLYMDFFKNTNPESWFTILMPTFIGAYVASIAFHRLAKSINTTTRKDNS
jgi:hypothetical protein